MECKKIVDYNLSIEHFPLTFDTFPVENSVFASCLFMKPICVNGCCKLKKLYCCCDMSCKIDDGTSTAIAYCNGKFCFSLLEIYDNDIIHFINNLLLEGKTYEYSYDYIYLYQYLYVQIEIRILMKK